MPRASITDSDALSSALLGLAVAATRLPLLHSDVYGLDPDAARIAAAGAAWVETGSYVPSRFPGYPLPEAAAALTWLAGGGPLVLNVLSVLLSGGAAAALFLLLRALNVERGRAALGSVAALMVPVSVAASVQSMDYVWALAPAVGALAAAARGRPLLSGALLGLAISSRLTAAVFAVPALLLLPRRSVASLSRGLVSTSAVVAVAFAVPLATFGGSLFWFSDAEVPWHLALQRATLDVWGPLGLVALAVGGIGLLVARRRSVDQRGVWAFGVGIALVVLSYLRLPLEGGYLLPIVPLVVGLFALLLRRGSFVAVCLLLIASPFVIDLESAEALPPGAHVLASGSGNVRLLAEGPAVVDRARMETRNRRTAEILATADTLGPGVALRLGPALPEAVMAAMRRPEGLPEAWLLYDDFPPRDWPVRTADEVLTLTTERPSPRSILDFRDR